MTRRSLPKGYALCDLYTDGNLSRTYVTYE